MAYLLNEASFDQKKGAFYLNRGPHLTSPKERNNIQPSLFGDTDKIKTLRG